MTKRRFWPQKTESLQLLPTAEVWDHMKEVRKMPSSIRSKMGLVIDCYSDLSERLKTEEFTLGQKMIMLAWDRTISNLEPDKKIGMQQLTYLWKRNLVLSLFREIGIGVFLDSLRHTEDPVDTERRGPKLDKARPKERFVAKTASSGVRVDVASRNPSKRNNKEVSQMLELLEGLRESIYRYPDVMHTVDVKKNRKGGKYAKDSD